MRGRLAGMAGEVAGWWYGVRARYRLYRACRFGVGWSAWRAVQR